MFLIVTIAELLKLQNLVFKWLVSKNKSSTIEFQMKNPNFKLFYYHEQLRIDMFGIKLTQF